MRENVLHMFWYMYDNVDITNKDTLGDTFRLISQTGLKSRMLNGVLLHCSLCIGSLFE